MPPSDPAFYKQPGACCRWPPPNPSPRLQHHLPQPEAQARAAWRRQAPRSLDRSAPDADRQRCGLSPFGYSCVVHRVPLPFGQHVVRADVRP